MDAKQFLKEKGISNNDFMDSGVADLIETLLIEYKALQLQQTGVNGSFCSNCRWLNSCTIKIDNNVDTCEEHEF